MDSFLNSFHQFVARRGTPAHCFSDNGTNLIAGQRCLKNGTKNWNEPKIVGFAAQRQIEWRFSPPSALHFDGVWERLVQSAKRALRVVLGSRTVNVEVLRTLICEVEFLLNGRLLAHVSVDPEDLSPLTPTPFHLGRDNANFPPDIFEDGKIISKCRWRSVQALTDSF